MWLIFGVIAIVVTVINLFLYAAGKDYKLAMAMALSFTALTNSANYSNLTRWVKVEDWAAITDVVPGMAKVFWFLTIVSILLNISPIFLEQIRKK
ncbi:hypothetical protein JF544_14865 [Halobacillus kuroshimensis]|uniref:MFS transporter n=1 Tax=Halobacillus kuroshimensis TaxID=302481 RepID=A0ABS3DZ70_9BACI|nr:hypothetical protein [Halobacillus kuroshimensis]MBN8236543.1 hypothetical protein [Halobacillus kuroshimensis]